MPAKRTLNATRAARPTDHVFSVVTASPSTCLVAGHAPAVGVCAGGRGTQRTVPTVKTVASWLQSKDGECTPCLSSPAHLIRLVPNDATWIAPHYARRADSSTVPNTHAIVWEVP